MIKFEQGSGRFNGTTQEFRFKATTDERPVICAISLEAFDDLIRGEVDEAAAEAVFAEWEAVVFKEAERKYEREGLNAQGALTLSTMDVAHRGAH